MAVNRPSVQCPTNTMPTGTLSNTPPFKPISVPCTPGQEYTVEQLFKSAGCWVNTPPFSTAARLLYSNVIPTDPFKGSGALMDDANYKLLCPTTTPQQIYVTARDQVSKCSSQQCTEANVKPACMDVDQQTLMLEPTP